MHRLRCCFLLLALVAAPALAHAQSRPAFTADEVVKRFTTPLAPSLGAPSLGEARGIGAARSVCVGTEAECKTAPALAPMPQTMANPAFDLMINFGLDSDRLTPDARQNLNEFAKALADPRLKAMSFEVDGHTDARGTDTHNMDLSRRRAEAVVQYLEARGVPRERVLPKAFGSANPRSGDPMDPTNRRVETRVLP